MTLIRFTSNDGSCRMPTTGVLLYIWWQSFVWWPQQYASVLINIWGNCRLVYVVIICLVVVLFFPSWGREKGRNNLFSPDFLEGDGGGAIFGKFVQEEGQRREGILKKKCWSQNCPSDNIWPIVGVLCVEYWDHPTVITICSGSQHGLF